MLAAYYDVSVDFLLGETRSVVRHTVSAEDRGNRLREIRMKHKLNQTQIAKKINMSQMGYSKYEISNFSKAGYASQHNTAYWKNKNYYGFGLNASGYENNLRYRNTSKIKDYINNPLKKEEEIELSIKEIMEEEIFLALRLKEGLNITDFNKKFKINFEQKYQKIIDKYENNQFIKGLLGYLFDK